MAEAVAKSWFRRGGLFGKYAVSFVALVVLVLAMNGGLETWFTYTEVTQLLSSAQSDKAEAIARRIEQYVGEIERQINSATRASSITLDQRKSDYALLLQQVPAVDRVIQLDRNGKEQLRLTREGAVERSGIDYSGNQRFKETQDKPVWLSPVYFDGPDPFMTIAMRHSGRNAGSTVAEINLKFLSNFFDPEQIGKDSDAFVVGPTGRLLAHTNPTYRLGMDMASLPQVSLEFGDGASGVFFGRDPQGRSVLTAAAGIERLNWHVFSEQLTSAALKPIYNLLYRTGWLVAAGIVLAMLAGMLLARQMVVPIRALQAGARQLEASNFGHRIDVKAAVEIEELADYFNRMAGQLRESYGRLEQKVEERTRDLEQSVRELKALEEIGRAVASSLDLNSVLATIVTRAVELSKADAGAIYSYDASRQVFELAEAHGVDEAFKDAIRDIQITVDESAMGFSAQKREPICIPDLSAAPEFPLKDLTLRAGFHSVLVVPLLGQVETSRSPRGPAATDRRFSGQYRRPDANLRASIGPCHEQCAAVPRSRSKGSRACHRQRAQGPVFCQHEP